MLADLATTCATCLRVEILTMNRNQWKLQNETRTCKFVYLLIGKRLHELVIFVMRSRIAFNFIKKHQEWLSIELSVTCRMYYVINTVSPLPIVQRLLSQKPTGLSISDLKGKPETKTQQSMINEGKINFEPSTSNVHETLRSLQLIKIFFAHPFASAPRTCLRSNSLKTELIRRWNYYNPCQTIMRIKQIFYSSGCF